MNEKVFAFATAALYLLAIWLWAYIGQGAPLSVCIILSLLALQIQFVSLAQSYIGSLFRIMEQMFLANEGRIDAIRKILGMPKEEKNEKKVG